MSWCLKFYHICIQPITNLFVNVSVSNHLNPCAVDNGCGAALLGSFLTDVSVIMGDEFCSTIACHYSENNDYSCNHFSSYSTVESEFLGSVKELSVQEVKFSLLVDVYLLQPLSSHLGFLVKLFFSDGGFLTIIGGNNNNGTV